MKIQQKKSFDYKWVIIALCFLMEFVALGFCSSNKGLYLGAISKANDLSRAAFSLNDTLRYAVSAAVNLFFGTLVLKFGARKMTAFGFAVLVGSIACYAYGSSLPVFYLGGALLGLGLAFTTTAMISFLIRNWVTENTGTVLGFVMAANGLGGALAAWIVTPIIGTAALGNFGYRTAYKLVMVILAVVGVLAVVFLREKPKGSTRMVAAKTKKKARGPGWEGGEFAVMKKRPYYIPACVGIFLTGMILSGINGIAGTMLKDDLKIDEDYVALVMMLHSLALMLFKFLAGVLYDRKGLRWMLTICEVAAVIVYVALVLSSNSATGRIFAMIYGVFSSLALPMETIGVSLVTADLFGNKAFDKMLGFTMSLNHLGYALGSPIMNFGYELFGSYKPVILMGAGLMTAVVISYQFIITAAHRDRKNLVAVQE